MVGAGRHGDITVSASTRRLIAEECEALKAMLFAKNEAYGDSVIAPVRIFSKASPEEQLRVRIDDKISRLVHGHAAGEDVEQDLIGYLILLRVQRRLATETADRSATEGETS